MLEIPKSVEAYLNSGDSFLMDKVRNFLSLELDYDAENSMTLSNWSISNSIALHINVDMSSSNFDDNMKANHMNKFTSIIRLLLLEYCEKLLLSKGSVSTLNFIDDFYDNLQIANWTHNNLDDFISALDIDTLRERYYNPVEPQDINITKTTLKWNRDKSEVILRKLADLISRDYDIIKAPVRFQNFFLKDDSNLKLSVNRNKIGCFVYLIDKLVSHKYLIVKGGKGYWAFLSQYTFDYEMNLLDKNRSKFKSLNSKIKKNREDNLFIINEIDEIFNQILK